MDRHPVGDFTETTMQKIREMVDVNTIVGDTISTPDGITIIPISKVSVGVGSGGGDFTKDDKNNKVNFGVGNISGISITPTAFLVVKDGDVRVLNVAAPAHTTLDRLVEIAPELVDKICALFTKDDENTNEPKEDVEY